MCHLSCTLCPFSFQDKEQIYIRTTLECAHVCVYFVSQFVLVTPFSMLILQFQLSIFMGLLINIKLFIDFWTWSWYNFSSTGLLRTTLIRYFFYLVLYFVSSCSLVDFQKIILFLMKKERESVQRGLKWEETDRKGRR